MNVTLYVDFISNVGHAFLSYVHHKPDKTGRLALVLLVNISVHCVSVQQIRDEGGGNGNFTYFECLLNLICCAY